MNRFSLPLNTLVRLDFFKMAARKDVSTLALILIFIVLNFTVKKKCYTTSDGFSITLNIYAARNYDENYYFSSLFVYKPSTAKPQKSCLCMLLLLMCGDIEQQPGPFSNIPELKCICSRRGLKICHQNIRGIQGKFDEISNLLQNFKVDVLTLNELFINNLQLNFSIPGFTFLCKNRKSGTGGGVGMFIRNGIKFVRKTEFEDDEIESIFIEICPKNSKSFIVSTIYRPPDSSKHLSKDFESILLAKLKNIDNCNKETIILGDLNVDYLTQNHDAIKHAFQLNGFRQLIKTATRAATLIDVIYTNKEYNISHSTVITAGFSDHDLIACVRKMNNIKYKPETIRCRNFKNYNVNQINNELLNKGWDFIYSTTSPNAALSYFISTLKETLNDYAPFITKKIKGKPSPWITAELTKEMNIRDQFLRKARKTNKTDDWSAYKRKRNYIKNEIQRSKRNYYKLKLEENARKPDRFWKIIKEIYPAKSKKENLPKNFQVDNKSIHNPKEIANGFCNFFSTIANKLKSIAFPLTNLRWRNQPTEVFYEKHQFTFSMVTDVQVLKILQGLNRNCATGLDEIPASFLKGIAFVIAKPLAHIINCSLKSDIFPDYLKAAKVTSIFKSCSSDNFDNYRPISVLSTISKVFEKCVHSQIIEHLEKHKLLSTQQFG